VPSSSYHVSRFLSHLSCLKGFARAGHAGSRAAFCTFLLTFCVLSLATCSFPGSVKPTIKIGLSAPFEGLYRDEGYEALYAARLAARQRNEDGGVGGRYLVELVALNDFNEPGDAVLQARKMAVDPGVMGVLGGWTPETVRAAAPEYRRLGLPFLAPEIALGPDSLAMPPDPRFAERYEELSGGVPPGPIAAWTYAAANNLMDAFAAAADAEGRPSRAGVQAMLDKSSGDQPE
jgi:ABC-type branched-subunit amino acid transport system substrate-binding protein